MISSHLKSEVRKTEAEHTHTRSLATRTEDLHSRALLLFCSAELSSAQLSSAQLSSAQLSSSWRGFLSEAESHTTRSLTERPACSTLLTFHSVQASHLSLLSMSLLFSLLVNTRCIADSLASPMICSPVMFKTILSHWGLLAIHTLTQGHEVVTI